jgi:hypothetical protein
MLTWHKGSLGIKTILLKIMSVMVITARIFIGNNTRAQLFAGFFAGVIQGILYHIIIYAWIVPNMKWFLSLRIIRWRGFTDTLCADKQKCNE